jgi:sec-independent protein translocase protein TatB
MFDIRWTELVLLGIVALIVIGPEDLPDMFRQIGRFTAKIRAMSREFSKAMNDAANDAGVKDVAKDLKSMTSTKGLGLNAVKDAADKFEK